jgi:mannose-6-phosphate isomerase-like protein (cupin superfamily)
MTNVRGIAETIAGALKEFPRSEFHKMLSSFEEYHGFEKVELPERFLDGILKGFGLTTKEVEVDVVRVTEDLRDKVHRHVAPAYCIILGESTNVPGPRYASAYLKDHWFLIDEGNVLDIPSLVDHGFTVETGGRLYFLSVQSPRRQTGDGQDDWQQN